MLEFLKLGGHWTAHIQGVKVKTPNSPRLWENRLGRGGGPVVATTSVDLLAGPEQTGAVTGRSSRQWWSQLSLWLAIAGRCGLARILLSALALLHVVEHVIHRCWLMRRDDC